MKGVPVPAQAARAALLALLLLACLPWLTGCAAKTSAAPDNAAGQAAQAEAPAPEPAPAETGFRVPTSRTPTGGEGPAQRLLQVYDPLEPMNRAVYDFNARFDHYVYLPLVTLYEAVTPVPLQKGISNFYNNIGEARVLVNSLLQFKGGKAVVTLGRLLANTTLGLAGFLDVATRMGLDKQDEDFGQTLGFYGLPAGPYLVLPVLGPSSLRDAAGSAGDGYLLSVESGYIFDALDVEEADPAYWAYIFVDAVDARHQQSFRYHGTGSPFEYTLVRYLYTKKRAADIEK